jgi:hypothetical protein
MTVEACIDACINQGNHIYAGLEDGTDCCKCAPRRSPQGAFKFRYVDQMFWMPPDCGDVLTPDAVTAPASKCYLNCGGDSTENCGSNDYLSLYWSGKSPIKPGLVENVPSAPLWSLLGCYR